MSNKKIAVFLIILVACVLGSLASAMALSEDFSVEYQKTQIDACSCGYTGDSYTIRNTGDVTSTYQLFKSGNAAQYSTFSENFFVLEPGQAKDVTNYINLPCDASGIYSETINISTVFGASKSFEQQLNVGRCANFEITPVESLQSSCPCAPVKYSINLKNTGSYEEIFQINTTGNEQYATISENSVRVPSNGNATVDIYYNFPCDISGDKEMSVNIKTLRTNYVATVPLKLKIRECYDFNVNANSKFTVCERDIASSFVDVKNNAEFSNAYSLETTEKYATVENSTLYVGSGQTASTVLNVDAGKLWAGNYSFNLLCTSERGQATKAVSAELNVEKCRDFIFDVVKPKTAMIASKDYDYYIEIENLGTKPGNFDVKVEGPSWLVLDKNRTSLAPGELGRILLKAKIPSDFVGADFARITVSEDFISDSQKITIKAITSDSAYLANLNVLNKEVKYDYSDINLSVSNEGVEAATYQLSLEGPEWMALSQNLVTLQPGESAIVPIRTSPTNETAEGSYAATITATVAEAGIGYASDFNVKLSSAPWYVKTFDAVAPFFLTYWLYIVIVLAAIAVLVILILLLKILGKRMKEKKKLRKEEEASKVVIPEPVMPKYEAKFQPFATPSIMPEQVPRFNIPEFKEKKHINWARFFSILFLLIVIGGVIALAALNWGTIAGFASNIANRTQQPAENNVPSDIYSPELEINRSTGIEGEGNVVYVRGDGVLDIPVTIKNKAPVKVVYTINNANASWISTDKKIISLDINGTDTLHLLVNATPDLPDGTYQIALGLNINDRDLKYSEKIDLRIDRTKPEFEKYLPYIIAGVVIVIILILLMALTRKSRFDVKKDSSDIQIVRVKEKQQGSGIFGKIIMIVIIIAIVVGTAYYISSLPKAPEQKYDDSFNLASMENQTIGIDLGYNDKVVIPFIFTNSFNSPATYHIETDVSWIEATDRMFKLNPGETSYVNITAIPTNDVTDGVYNSTILVELNSENVEYSKTIVFQLRDRSLGKALIENKFFVIGVAIVVIGLLLLATFKKKKQEKREFLAEIKQEIQMEKEKKAIPKTEIKFKVPKKRK